MKIIVAGDNHRNLDILKKIVSDNIDADLFLHTGDSELLEFELYPFISVKGNNDRYADLPKFRYFNTPSGEIYLTHGNYLFGVTESIVKDSNSKIFIHGHTHVHYIKEINGTYVCSPGSTSFPRDNTKGTYLIINIEDNKEPEFNFIYL